MKKDQQIIKNLDLSEKLAGYIADNPDVVEKFPSKASYVPFSLHDDKLNKANEKLVESLKEESKYIIKAQQTDNRNHPWNFTLIFSSV